MLTAFPLSHTSAAPPAEVSLASTSSSGKREPGETSSCPTPSTVDHCAGALTLISHHYGLQRGLWGPSTRNMTVMKKVRGACNNKHKDFGKLSSGLLCSSRSPNKWFGSTVDPSQGCVLTRELSGGTYLIGILK